MGVPALFFSAYVLATMPVLTTLPLCAVKLFANVDCPGCGLTRSIAYLTHGELRRSIDFNPMGIVIAFFLVYIFVRTAISLLAGRALKPLLQQKTRDRMLVVFVFALFAQWLFKLYFLLFTFHF